MKQYNEREIESILHLVEKPGRYAGGERNSIVKDDEFVFALSYPDMYEIGMSNNGIKILYEILNAREGISCERVFCPAPDMSALLKKNDLKLFTLERRIALNSVAAVGFNYSHELLATNILHILETGGIPLKASERSQSDPIIVIGGECTSNPAPVAPFADIIFCGEGEDAIVEIASIIKSGREDKLQRSEILKNLSSVAGVFVPSLYERIRGENGFLFYQGPEVLKRFCRNDLLYPQKPVVPMIRVSHEKAVVELARGCKNMCNFCHAGFCTLPYREYQPAKIFESIKRIVENTGYNEVTFSALSVSDYSKIDTLVNLSMPYFNENGVSVSLPSMKVDKTNLPLIDAVSDVRESSITFAVEAADDMMRRRIHKKLSMDDLYEIIDEVFRSGWKLIKLYFMIGLPGYKECDEAESIIEALKKINDIGRRKKRINVTVSPFIPKPHTPFEREETGTEEYFRETVLKIKRALPRNIAIKAHDPFGSILESFISRGDESVSEIIYEAYKSGAFLDSWEEYCNKNAWKEVLSRHSEMLHNYMGSRSGELPWKIIHCVDDALLEKKRELMDESRLKARPRDLHIEKEQLAESLKLFERKYTSIATVRLIMEKKGRSRFVSHNDMLDTIRRAMRSAAFPVAFTQGFNKREKMSASFPIPLGIESEFEIIDAELYADIDFADALVSLNKALPSGMKFIRCETSNGKNLMINGSVLGYRISGVDSKEILEKIKSDFIFIKESDKGRKEIPAGKAVHSYSTDGESLILNLSAGTPESVRIDNVLKQLTGADSIAGFTVVKTAQYDLDKAGKLVSMI